MEHKRILIKSVVAALMFGALVFAIEELLYHNKQDLGSVVMLLCIMLPIKFLGTTGPDLKAHSLYLFGVNAAIYAAALFLGVFFLRVMLLNNSRKEK